MLELEESFSSEYNNLDFDQLLKMIEDWDAPELVHEQVESASRKRPREDSIPDSAIENDFFFSDDINFDELGEVLFPSTTLTATSSSQHEPQKCLTGITSPQKETTKEKNDRESSQYVLMSRAFERPVGSHLTEGFVITVMNAEFPTEAPQWIREIHNYQDLYRRDQFISSMCANKDIRIKLLFCLVRFLDYKNNSDQGRMHWDNRSDLFAARFRNSIVRILSKKENHIETFRRNPTLMQSLEDSFACMQYLFTFMALHRNLCFFLLVVSCIEGRGVYHGRTSNGLSVPHKCYRYMIERLGGCDYSETPESKRKPAERLLVAFFEDH